jgi:hypothetical protein
MVLAMFVDANRLPLLTALAGGSVFVTPSIVDPNEVPPFLRQPISEFAKGVHYFQQRLGRPLDATRLARRMAFYQGIGAAWQPVQLSPTELSQAQYLASPVARLAAQNANPAVSIKRVDRGEAECAAVAIARGWRLWTDDAAIISLVSTLYPGHPIERVSDLLARAVQQGFVPCSDAIDLYNRIFKGELRLWSRLSAACEQNALVFR